MNSHSSPCLQREPTEASAASNPGASSAASPETDPDPCPLTVTVYGPDAVPDGFAVLAPEWNRLLSRSYSDVFFLTHEWQTVWWQQLGRGELWILAFHCPRSAELVGIAPLYRVPVDEGRETEHYRLSIVGCIEVSDYLDLIVARGWATAVYQSFFAWLNGPDAPAWDVLDLCNLPEASPSCGLLPELWPADRGQLELFQEDVAPAIALPARFEEYLQHWVDKKQRHEIRRKQRRAEREADVGLSLVGPDQNLAAEVDDFIALQMMSRDDKAIFMDQEMQRFFHAVARTTAASGHLRLFFLTLNGEKAAVLYAFEYNRQLLLYNSGYDPDSYAHLSPGWVLLTYAIQYAIANGFQLFDFMQGDEEYKFHFGSRAFNVMRVTIHRSA